MDERTEEFKRRKIACKKAKRKHVALWKVLTLCFLFFALVATVAAPASYLTDNFIAGYLELPFYHLENPDAAAVYNPVELTLPQQAESSDTMPTLGATNGLKLSEMTGLSWDDPLWDTLLDQLTYWDMLALTKDTYGFCLPVASVSAPGCAVTPAQLPQDIDGLDDASVFMLGRAMGSEAISDGILCLSVPADVYRSPLCDGMRASGIHVTKETSQDPIFRLDLYYKDATNPQVVNALREDCRLELYGRANSLLMNNIGPETKVVTELLLPVRILHWAVIGCWVLTFFFLIFWIRGKKKWKQTMEYLDWRTVKNVLKAEKIAKKI